MQLTRVLSNKLPYDRGGDVLAVQKALMAISMPEVGPPDGVYGATTAAAVLRFQAEYNRSLAAGVTPLAQDGKVGPQTWAALFERAAPKSSSSLVKAAQEGEPPPLTPERAQTVKAWMRKAFGAKIDALVASANLDTNPPFDADTVYAIAGKETAIKWLPWIADKSKKPEDILARCVFDASGDWPNTSRGAFPQNTAIFNAKYPDLTQMLIEEANKTRAWQGWNPKAIVYKGYGIFQYDLQHIDEHRDFFAEKQWGDIDKCLERLIAELREKRKLSTTGSLWEVLRRYNGSGSQAETYADHVMKLRDYCAGR